MRSAVAIGALLCFIISEPAISQASGVQELHTILIGGVERRWRIFVPDQYEDGVALPLVLNFHGTGSTPDQQSRLSEFEALAAKAGFLVASPEARFSRERDGKLTWNVDLVQGDVDDVLFVQEMIDEIRKQISVDSKRIYATGFSGGGRMSSRLACDLSELIAAIGPVAGSRYPEDCVPSRPVPVITFHGKNDPVNHYEYQSDSPAYWRMGVEDAIGGWVQNNKCAGHPTEEHVSTTVTRVSYHGCEGGADIVFYRSEDAGHTWPGSPLAQMLEEMGLGNTNSEVAATNLIWEFFEDHPLH